MRSVGLAASSPAAGGRGAIERARHGGGFARRLRRRARPPVSPAIARAQIAQRACQKLQESGDREGSEDLLRSVVSRLACAKQGHVNVSPPLRARGPPVTSSLRAGARLRARERLVRPAQPTTAAHEKTSTTFALDPPAVPEPAPARRASPSSPSPRLLVLVGRPRRRPTEEAQPSQRFQSPPSARPLRPPAASAYPTTPLVLQPRPRPPCSLRTHQPTRPRKAPARSPVRRLPRLRVRPLGR